MPQRFRARFLPAVLIAALLLAAAPAAAQSDGESGSGDAERMAREGIERLMNALETFLSSIPQYGVPYIDDDSGDIVIPRLNPDEKGGEDESGKDPAAPSEQTEI